MCVYVCVCVCHAQVQLVGFDGQLPKLDTYLVLKDVTYYTLPDMTVQKPPGIRILDTWARRVQVMLADMIHFFARSMAYHMLHAQAW